MAIGTKDIPEASGGGVSKMIEPGEHVLKINKVVLQRYPFMDKDQGYFLVIHAETKPIEGFEGFFFDKENESLGKHAGQIGQIKTNRFYYKDGVTKGGTKVVRDVDILREIKAICVASGSIDWFDKVDDKFETIEDFMDAFNTKKPYGEDKFFKVCVAGKEFERANTYIGYDLHFPKFTKGSTPIEELDVTDSKLTQFDVSKHWIKLKPKAVESFGGDADAAPGTTLEGAPEFDL